MLLNLNIQASFCTPDDDDDDDVDDVDEDDDDADDVIQNISQLASDLKYKGPKKF